MKPDKKRMADEAALDGMWEKQLRLRREYHAARLEFIQARIAHETKYGVFYRSPALKADEAALDGMWEKQLRLRREYHAARLEFIQARIAHETKYGVFYRSPALKEQ